MQVSLTLESAYTNLDTTNKADRPSWLVAILPYLDEKASFERRKQRLRYGSNWSVIEACSVPIATYYCPSRRAPVAYLYGTSHTSVVRSYGWKAGKTDYAINSGAYVSQQSILPGIGDSLL